jgi:hypothetical protein
VFFIINTFAGGNYGLLGKSKYPTKHQAGIKREERALFNKQQENEKYMEIKIKTIKQ